MPLAFWLQLRRRRCSSRKMVNDGAGGVLLRCELELDHELTGATAFDRQHRACDGFTVRFWP